jgi:hypothetical protein
VRYKLETENRMKARKSVRKELELLQRLVKFVNGETKVDYDLPRFSLATDQPSPLESTRSTVNRMLRLIAARANRPAGSFLYRVNLPPLPRTLVLSSDTATLAYAEDFVAETVVPAIAARAGKQVAWRRLRLCKCGKIFVALNVRAEYCSPECSNRQRQKTFYNANILQQQRIKLARYHVNRIRRAAAQNRPTKLLH